MEKTVGLSTKLRALGGEVRLRMYLSYDLAGVLADQLEALAVEAERLEWRGAEPEWHAHETCSSWIDRGRYCYRCIQTPAERRR